MRGFRPGEARRALRRGLREFLRLAELAEQHAAKGAAAGGGDR